MTLLVDYTSTQDLPGQIPVFPLSGALLLPRAQLPLNIFEPRYVRMVSDALSGERLIGMVQPDKDKERIDANDKPSVYQTGCAGRITSYTETPDGRILLSLTGVCRFQILNELTTVTPYRVCQVDFDSFANDLDIGRGENTVDREKLVETFRKYLTANRMDADWDEVNNATTEALVNTLCVISPFAAAEKQALLEAESLSKRAETLIVLTEMALAGDDPAQLQ